jgi:hypothetical protein
MNQQPREVIDQIADELTPPERWRLRQAGVPLKESHMKHSRAWGTVFKDSTGLQVAIELGANPVFVGRDVHKIYNKELTGPINLILLFMDWTGRLSSHHSVTRRGLLPYMQAHDYDPDRYEVRLRGTNITVNIQEFVTGYESTITADLERFIDVQNCTTSVLYYSGATRPVQHALNYSDDDLFPLHAPGLYHITFAFCLHPRYNYPLKWSFSECQETKVDSHSQASITSSPCSSSDPLFSLQGLDHEEWARVSLG